MTYPDLIEDNLPSWLEKAELCWEETHDDEEAESLLEDLLKEELDPRHHHISKIAVALLQEQNS